MCSRDRKQSENSGVTLLSQETTSTNVSEFQDIEEEPKSPPPKYSPHDVIFKLTDETKHDYDEERNQFDLDPCDCKFERNKEHKKDCSEHSQQAVSDWYNDCRNTKETNKCSKNIGCKTQSEPLIKKVKHCSCSSNADVFDNKTDKDSTDMFCCNVFIQYQDLKQKYIDVMHRCDELVNTFQKQPAENIRLRKMYIKLKKLFVALAVVNIIVIIIVIAIMPLMMVTFKLSEKPDKILRTEDGIATGVNKPSVQEKYTSINKLFIRQTVFCVACAKLSEIVRDLNWNDVRETTEGCCFTDLLAFIKVFVQERHRLINEDIYPYIKRQIATLSNRPSNRSDSGVRLKDEDNNNPPFIPPINDVANSGLLAVIDQLTSKRRSVIHLKSKSQVPKSGIGWSPRFAPQGDLTMGSDGRSIRVITGGLYFIYSHVQFSRNANVSEMRNVTLGFTLTRTNNDGVVIDKEDVQQRCMFRDGTLEHPSTIQTVMLLEGEDKVSVSVPEHQQTFLSRDSGKHAFGMFEL